MSTILLSFSHFVLDSRDAGDTSCNRTLWSIIWSCLLTVFTCTWVAIHPNAASETEAGAVVTIRRIGLMVAMFLVPEMVVCWALRQWILATYYAKKYETNASGIKWKRIHGFFLIMGGFSYYNDDRVLVVLTASKMEELYKKGLIEWPIVTAKQIRDRSKADFLSKLIVIVQTGWFCLQLVVRLIAGLVVTELEISTLAFAVINVVVYALWWNKPFDVRSHVVVRGTNTPKITYNPNPEQPQPARGHTSLSSHKSIDTLVASISDSGTHDRSSHFSTEQPVTFEKSDVGNVPKRTKLKGRTYLKQKIVHIWRSLRDAGLSGPIDLLFMYLAILYGFFGAPFLIHYVEKGSPPPANILSPPKDPYNSDPDAKDRHPRCAWLFDFHTQLALVSFVGIIYGGIHLIAWPFHFPTLAERWLWRASSLALILPPILLQIRTIIIASFGLQLNLTGWGEQVVMCAWITFMVLCAASYMTARGIISILPIIALRDAPPGALVNINWTSLIPHI